MWTLFIILFGFSGPPAIDASLKFSDRLDCEKASATVFLKMKGKGSHVPYVECVQTDGRR